METLLQVQEICKYYRMGEVQITAVDHVSFSVEKGEFVVIVGASGAGKTTVLNLLGGMDTCDSGSILVDGTDITKLRKRKLAAYRRFDIGFVFQFYNLIPVLNVVENITLPVLMDGRKVNDARLQELLDTLGLRGREKHLPNQLSGGQQQRVAIARALINKPKILLADEPTGNLDSRTGQEVMELLCEIFRERNTTFILSSHDPQMQCYTDRTVYFSDGKIEIENHHTGEENAQ